ncbi:hypothetical protein F5B20DRAFT_534238 [Whalleya microplaca]|nr:hypothetical protein F5B20DRAFT_534238 [Whalleya microplaca]
MRYAIGSKVVSVFGILCSTCSGFFIISAINIGYEMVVVVPKPSTMMAFRTENREQQLCLQHLQIVDLTVYLSNLDVFCMYRLSLHIHSIVHTYGMYVQELEEQQAGCLPGNVI